MEESLKVSQPEQATTKTQPTATDATKPQLPPAHAISSGKTVDEVWEDLNKSPLFMTDLDVNEENDDIAALQALAYEGTPLENGQEFKERGNEYFKIKNYVDAKEFYGKGIAILAGEERKRARGEQTKNQEGVIDTEEEIQKQRETLEA
ncbi:hypothetical protein ACHAP7_012298, partial [Fusarium lateritium]